MISILVIDQAGSCRGVRKVLPATGIPGFKINFATSYRDMFEGFRGNAYDVCVIDSASGNGHRLFSESRSLGYTEPVILVTSNDASEAVSAIRSGVADCLIREDMTATSIERLLCSVVEQAKESGQQNGRARRHRALLDSADEIIFSHDLEGNITSMSSSGEQLTGYAQDEWLSLPVSQIFGPAHREVAERLVRQLLDERRQSFCEIEMVTKHGEGVRVEASLHLVYQLGTAVEIQWIARESSATDLSAGAFFRNARLHVTARSDVQRSSV